MLNIDNLSKQYKHQMMLKGLGRCPRCGGVPSIRSPKGKLCERHVEMRAEQARKRIKARKRHIPLSDWLQVDWTLGAKAIMKLLGMGRNAVHRNYRKLLWMKKIKAVPGFIQPVGGEGRPRKSPRV